MLLLLAAFLMMAVHTTFSVNDDLIELFKSRQQANQRHDIAEVAAAIGQFEQETGAYPANVAAMININGYEHLRPIIERRPNLEYELATIVGTDYTYNRFIVFIQDHFDADTRAVYLADNQCGADAFNVALDFCPNESANYHIDDNRKGFFQARLRAQYTLDHTMAKLLMWGGQAFPFDGMAAGSSTTLAAAVGYVGTYAACSGSFSYGDATLSCNDLFNEWGNDIVLNKVTDNQVALMSTLPFTTPVGDPVYLLRDVLL